MRSPGLRSAGALRGRALGRPSGRAGLTDCSALPGRRLEFTLVHPVGVGERLRLRAYFGRSLVRATVRWAKHIVTFEGWLDYILRKVRRHEGTEVELSPRERRLPLLFLWPRLFRYLRHKNR